MLAAAEQLPEIRAVATIGAPADTNHLLHLLADSREAILDDGEAEVCLAWRPLPARHGGVAGLIGLNGAESSP